MERVVIIGAGQGGFQAAASLRQEGFDGEILLIGDEQGRPYQRPPLSKAYLKGGTVQALSLRPDSFFEPHKIILRTGCWVRAIDRANARVEIDGEQIAYDHLIIATGARNLRPQIAGLEHTIGLRTLHDASAIKASLVNGVRVGVIGGGFIGLEFAAVARELGHSVIVAEGAPRLMARAVSEPMAARFAEKHRQLGTEIILGDAVAEIDSAGFTLASGRHVDTDLTLLAVGVVPNVELAKLAGLQVDSGIVVDEMLVTSDPAISALGDCAAFPDPVTGCRVRLESVQAATDHARLIAKRIAKGGDAPYRAVPWFWSDQADWKLQIAGLARPSDTAEELADGTVLRFCGSRITAVETINNAKVHMTARKGMASGVPLTRQKFDVTPAEVLV